MPSEVLLKAFHIQPLTQLMLVSSQLVQCSQQCVQTRRFAASAKSCVHSSWLPMLSASLPPSARVCLLVHTSTKQPATLPTRLPELQFRLPHSLARQPCLQVQCPQQPAMPSSNICSLLTQPRQTFRAHTSTSRSMGDTRFSSGLPSRSRLLVTSPFQFAIHAPQLSRPDLRASRHLGRQENGQRKVTIERSTHDSFGVV